jgi:hypothetical protein
MPHDPRVVTLRLQGFSVSISCHASAIAETVCGHFAPWLASAPAGETFSSSATSVVTPADIAYTIVEDVHENRCTYLLSSPFAPVSRAHSLSDLIIDLQTRLDEEVLRRTTCVPIHAGVVAWKGRAILLPGASRYGKTTLVAELSRRGATYFSDEFALLDAEGHVHPYPRSLLVRIPASEDLRQPVPASSLAADIGMAAVPVGMILSTRYVEDAAFVVERIPASQAVMMLLQNTPHIISERPALRESITCTARNAVAYSGVRGDAARAADAVLALLR